MHLPFSTDTELPLPLIFANVAVSRCPSQRHSYDEIVLCCTLLGENHDKIETNLMTIVQNQSQLNHCESWPNKIQFPKRSITKLNNESNFSMTQREIKEKNELRCEKEKRSRMGKCRGGWYFKTEQQQRGRGDHGSKVFINAA
jgi:hypothetical protein